MSEVRDALDCMELIVGEEEVIAMLLYMYEASEIEYHAECGQIIFRRSPNVHKSRKDARYR